MEIKRSPFQGVKNIVSFNRYLFLIATMLIVSTFLLSFYYIFFMYVTITILCFMIVSLTVSWYVYDASNLYDLRWLTNIKNDRLTILNISAGFDEINDILIKKFPEAEIIPLDFYDPIKHTEISIKIARKAYPPSKAVTVVNTTKLPFKNNSAQYVLLFLSAHEIRDTAERIHFFSELRRILKREGTIYVTEHLRDINNFIAYNIGVFHFHSVKTWTETFNKSGLDIHKNIKSTPFISTFVLTKYGNSL